MDLNDMGNPYYGFNLDEFPYNPTNPAAYIGAPQEVTSSAGTLPSTTGSWGAQNHAHAMRPQPPNSGEFHDQRAEYDRSYFTQQAQPSFNSVSNAATRSTPKNLRPTSSKHFDQQSSRGALDRGDFSGHTGNASPHFNTGPPQGDYMPFSGDQELTGYRVLTQGQYGGTYQPAFDVDAVMAQADVLNKQQRFNSPQHHRRAGKSLPKPTYGVPADSRSSRRKASPVSASGTQPQMPNFDDPSTSDGRLQHPSGDHSEAPEEAMPQPDIQYQDTDRAILTPAGDLTQGDSPQQEAITSPTPVQEVVTERLTLRKRTRANNAEAAGDSPALKRRTKTAKPKKMNRSERARQASIAANIKVTNEQDALQQLKAPYNIMETAQNPFIFKPYSAAEAESRLRRITKCTMHKLKVPGDNVNLLNDEVLEMAAKRIFNHLAYPAQDAPEDLEEAAQEHMNKSQRDRLKLTKGLMATQDDKLDASARCRYVVDQIVKLHTQGIPMADLDLREYEDKPQVIDEDKIDTEQLKSKRDYLVDHKTTCIARLHKLGSVVRDCKFVAYDLLNDPIDELRFIVYGPEAYRERKMYNAFGNQARKVKKDNAQEAQEELKKIKASDGKK